MITCNRCGSANPTEAIQCQVCGTPLNEQGPNTRKNVGAARPAELPAWLESLRTQERPPSSSQNSSVPSFNAAGLIDDGGLPAWMRPESIDDSTPSNAYGAIDHQNALDGLRPASMFAPNTDESPMEGFSASSLVDEKSLPGWLRGQDSGGAGATPNGIVAASLVEPNALPSWMQALSPQAAQPPQPSLSMQAPSTPQPQQAVPPVLPTSPSSPSMPLAQGFSARDLVDPQALPAWMRQAGEQGTPGAQRPREQAPFADQQMSPAQPAQPELPVTSGFSASSLIDANSLPDWLHNNAQPDLPRTGGSGATWSAPQGMPSAPYAQAPQPSTRQSGPSWQAPVQASSSMPVMPGSLDASSLMDVSSLPDWLRPAAEQQMAQQGNAGYVPGYVPGYVRPTSMPRSDNVRVPSRPRGEPGAHEGSEVAANVFASMLGVASTPNFPASSQGVQSVGQAGPPRQPAQPGGTSGMQAPIAARPPTAAGSNPMSMPPTGSMMGAPGAPVLGQQPPQSYMSGTYQPNTAGSGPMRPNTNMGVSSVAQNMGMAAAQSEEAKPVKRGLFEAIRSWLSRS